MLDWFTTIPGILIICGAILLVVAIVMFTLGGKKSKKNQNAVNASNVNPVPTATVDSVAPTISAMPGTQTVSVTEPVSAMPGTQTVSVTEPVSAMPGTQTVSFTEPAVDSTISNPNLNITPASNDVFTAVNPVPTATVDSVAPTIFTMPEPTPIAEPEMTTNELSQANIVMPQMQAEPSVANIPNVNEQNIPSATEANPTVYGGVSPVPDFSIQNETPVTIYGGNDPLEATQSLPKIEEHHEPYGGVYPEVKIVEPNQPIEIPTPVEETISTASIDIPVEDVQIPQPSVIEIPSVENVNQENSTVSDQSVPTPVVESPQQTVLGPVEEL